MLTKQQFYNALKQYANKHRTIDFSLRFEAKGIRCILSFGITPRYIPSTGKEDWYLDAQLKNDSDVPLWQKYIAKDLYGKLIDFGITSDYKCWKFIEKWINDSVDKYLKEV